MPIKIVIQGLAHSRCTLPDHVIRLPCSEDEVSGQHVTLNMSQTHFSSVPPPSLAPDAIKSPPPHVSAISLGGTPPQVAIRP